MNLHQKSISVILEDFPLTQQCATNSDLEFQILNYFTKVLQGDKILAFDSTHLILNQQTDSVQNMWDFDQVGDELWLN
jgi:hypothetical protein